MKLDLRTGGVPFFILIALAVTCLILSMKTKSYKLENRKLLIQNDSIISVNMELEKINRSIYDSLGNSKDQVRSKSARSLR
jgi:hypothetical protein